MTNETQSTEAKNGTLKVLIVDDGRSAADILAMFFQLEGHEVRVAYDGMAGVDQAAAFRPHLVLMDISMPGIDGLEAARRIRRQPGGDQMVIVALSGYDHEDDKRSCEQAGINQHLAKPVCPDDLRQLLKRHGDKLRPLVGTVD